MIHIGCLHSLEYWRDVICMLSFSDCIKENEFLFCVFYLLWQQNFNLWNGFGESDDEEKPIMVSMEKYEISMHEYKHHLHTIQP